MTLPNEGKSDSDCLSGGCAYLGRGDTEQFCCGRNGLFGAHEYCYGTVGYEKPCWFDGQCQGEGYCEGVCYPPKKIGEACDNDDECQNSVAYCDDTCKPKIENFHTCSYNGQCFSGACGITDPGDSKKCCESGDTFWLYYYNKSGSRVMENGCTGVKKDQETCYANDHCISDYCMGERYIEEYDKSYLSSVVYI